MTNASKHALLEAAARKLAWELYSTANWCRQRAYLNVDKFEHELFSAAKHWRTIRDNLNNRKPERSKKNGNTRNEPPLLAAR
jgi:hypothetical protein